MHIITSENLGHQNHFYLSIFLPLLLDLFFDEDMTSGQEMLPRQKQEIQCFLFFLF